LLSSGYFVVLDLTVVLVVLDILDLTVVLVVLELQGLLETELEIRDWELVISVTEPSCLTSSFQNGKAPSITWWVCLS
jgi:hypothetical protein